MLATMQDNAVLTLYRGMIIIPVDEVIRMDDVELRAAMVAGSSGKIFVRPRDLAGSPRLADLITSEKHAREIIAVLQHPVKPVSKLGKRGFNPELFWREITATPSPLLWAQVIKDIEQRNESGARSKDRMRSPVFFDTYIDMVSLLAHTFAPHWNCSAEDASIRLAKRRGRSFLL